MPSKLYPRLYFCFPLIFFLLAPISLVLAAPFSSAPDITVLFSNAMKFVLKILGALGVIAFVFCGILYLTSAGNIERAATAKRYFTFSVIGLVISLGSLIIILTIDSLLR
ncbi:MAG: hypothetical protein ABIC19_01185 [Patescibacteria group bacterium]|nr:hypothetical protein [Patescibacteria group bacterium]